MSDQSHLQLKPHGWRGELALNYAREKLNPGDPTEIHLHVTEIHFVQAQPSLWIQFVQATPSQDETVLHGQQPLLLHMTEIQPPLWIQFVKALPAQDEAVLR